jgi:ABC-type Fe3+-siderophore transport system, permease component
MTGADALQAPPAPPDLRAVLHRARRRRRWQFAALVALLLGSSLVALSVGPMRIPPAEIGGFFLSRVTGGESSLDGSSQIVIERIRLPRLAMSALVGAALAVAGAAMQGLFRNPLADPGLIGISAGAAVGAVAVIVLGQGFLPRLPDWAAPFLLAAAAFAGCLCATLLIYRLSLHEGQPIVATMLLAGVAVNALCGAITAFMTFLASDQQVRDVTFWLLGSLGGATWAKTGIVAICVLPGLVLLPRAARALNALLLGESDAEHLGFDPNRTKWIVIAASTVMVGASVAFTGIVAFVGLIVPHAVRLAAGPDHRFLLPASALLGAALMTAADSLARCVVAPAELPIGILTSLIGAPFFLWLLLRAKGAWQP